MRLSVVCVHYHTPELVAPALEAVRLSARRAQLEVELFVVDNGSTSAGRRALDALPDVQTLDVGRNLGYGGGANHGFSRSSGDLLLLMNPDVVVDRDCIGSLAAVLRAGAGCVGPRFTWDQAGELFMPPADARGFADEMTRAWAHRGGRWERQARERWRRHAQRHWRAETALESEHLSGALLLMRREAWKRVGPFDEEFRLYFEETDWLRRARGLGVELRYVANAQGVHFYDQSASGEPLAREWFEQSAARFREKSFGAMRARLLSAVEARSARRTKDALRPSSAEPPPEAGQPAWLEISPSERGFPAVGSFFPHGRDPDWQLPPDVRQRHPELELTGRWVRESDGVESPPFEVAG